MSENFWKILDENYPYSAAGQRGYKEDEVRKIEKLYGVKFSGQLREFMLKMGRCSGGIFGDDPLIIYRSSWSVRTHLLFQFNFTRDVQDLRKFNHLLRSPFVFSWEGESMYGFLQTDSESPDRVFFYEESEKKVYSSELDFFDYLLDLKKENSLPPAFCFGELIDLDFLEKG